MKYSFHQYWFYLSIGYFVLNSDSTRYRCSNGALVINDSELVLLNSGAEIHTTIKNIKNCLYHLNYDYI